VGSRYAREDKKKGIFGYKRFLFPLIKPVCSSSMMSSVPHEIAAHEGAVPVPFRHSGHPCRIVMHWQSNWEFEIRLTRFA
jgi:hypothetical protein